MNPLGNEIIADEFYSLSSLIYEHPDSSRIAALKDLNILDTEEEAGYNEIVNLAINLFNVPIAIIAFTDADRIWIKAKTGIEKTNITREYALFSDFFLQGKFQMVCDTRKDNYYCDKIFIDENVDVRFFAQVAIKDSKNNFVGHLCVMDTKPGLLNEDQLSALFSLGHQVTALLELRTKSKKLKKAEQETNYKQELIDTMFNKTNDAIVVCNEKGIVKQWNPSASRIFGWEEDEVMDQVFHELLIPSKYQRAYRLKMMYYSAGDDSQFNQNFEIIGKKKNGEEFYIEIGVAPTKIKNKLFFINFIKDIHTNKVNENTLARQKTFYENILNKIPADIVVFDKDHKYQFVNPGAISVKEYREYIIGKDDFDYCAYRGRDTSLAELRRNEFLELKASGKEKRWEDTVTDKDGRPHTSLRRLFPVYDENNDLEMVIGFGININDRKAMEDKQAHLLNQLSIQNMQLNDFCNIVSHNLRGPLVNISMLIEFIETTKNEDEKNLFLSKLKPLINNVNGIFNELIETIKVKNDFDIHFDNNNTLSCINKILSSFEMEISKYNATVKIDVSETPIISFPSKYFISILQNLISNAIKYRNPNKQLSISINTIKIDGAIQLSVSDNGLGIDLKRHKDNLFKIGKIFHRHPNAKGFGLFMTKTQIEAMNGKIWVESEPGVGSTFFVEIKQ